MFDYVVIKEEQHQLSSDVQVSTGVGLHWVHTHPYQCELHRSRLGEPIKYVYTYEQIL